MNDLDLVGVDVTVAVRARHLAVDRGIRGMGAVYLVVAAALASGPVSLLSFAARQRSAVRDGDGVVLIPSDLS